MPLKDYEVHKKKMLENYYKNKDKILTYQIERSNKLYHNSEEYKNYKKFRDKSIRYKKIDKSCFICNSIDRLQRHHPNYNNLDFITLCIRCHNDVHIQLRELHSYSIPQG